MSDLNNMNPPSDSENPLGDIDPMAWLESLAARQGATEGFTTSEYSSIEIPEIDPNSVVIDEPGYTPYESFGKDTSQVLTIQEPPSAQPAAPAETFVPESLQTFGQPNEASVWGGAEQQQPETVTGIPEGVDPLAWLENLAARQGATEGFTTSDYGSLDIPVIDPNSVVIDEPGYTPSESFHREPAPAEQAPVPQSFGQAEEPSIWSSLEQPQSAAPEAVTGIPEGVDPLAWLENLAARQGATEGFTTNDYSLLDIPEIDPNSVVIDEPGYTPSESFHREPAAPQGFGQALEQPDEAQAEPAQEWGSFDFSAGEPTNAVDFLDALSENAEVVPNEADSAPDMSWLSELSGSTGVTGSLSFLEQLDEPVGEQTAPQEEAIPATHTPDQVSASIDGMTDEELAQAQVNRTLTPEQELAWLQRQAMSLYQARQHESPEEELSLEDLAPAEAAEIPSWLQQSAVISDESEDSSIFVAELAVPEEPEDMPDWLRGDIPVQTATSEMELPDFTLEAATGAPPEPAAAMPVSEDTIHSLSMLKLEEYDPALDEWAEALDEEHDRIEAGLEEDPTWFRTAKAEAQLAEAAGAGMTAPAAPSEEASWLGEIKEETSFGVEIPDDLPDWLRPVAAAAATTSEPEDIDIGTWLRDEETAASRGGQGIAAMAGIQASPGLSREESGPRLDVPPSEAERLAPASAGALPNWARSTSTLPALPPQPPSRTAPPPPPPVQPRVEPVPRPAAVPPPPRPTGHHPSVAAGEPMPPASPPAAVPDNFAEHKTKLELNPDDHTTRLELAREMVKTGDLDSSVQQYQTLVEQMGDLDTVSEDLRGLITTTPSYPALRRLLGDIYMRQGYLQEALDAYRGALDNL